MRTRSVSSDTAARRGPSAEDLADLLRLLAQAADLSGDVANLAGELPELFAGLADLARDAVEVDLGGHRDSEYFAIAVKGRPPEQDPARDADGAGHRGHADSRDRTASAVVSGGPVLRSRRGRARVSCAVCRPELRALAPRLLPVRRAVLSRLEPWLRLALWLRPALWRPVVWRELALGSLALRPAVPPRLELC